MGKGSRSRSRFWRGILVEAIAVIAVVLLVTSGRIHPLRSVSAESPEGTPVVGDLAGSSRSDDAVERELRRAGARLQRWVSRHLEGVRSDLEREVESARRVTNREPRTVR